MTDFNDIVARQQAFFKSGITRTLQFRKDKLRALYDVVKKNEKEISQALFLDLHKSPYETYFSETGLVLDEIRFMLRNLRAWMKPGEVTTPLVNFPARSYRYPEPRGIVLIIAPWNYPFYLLMMPLAGAIAAGNVSVVKPSEISSHTSSLIKKMLDEAFPREFVATVTGGAEMSTELLNEAFDYIFFTGSSQVGKVVAQAAAKNMTPVTLELGGKSPCIVDRTANISIAARRIAWGKWLNAGQTCVAPDYVYVEQRIKEQLIDGIKREIAKFSNGDAIHSEDYPRIVNDKHFQRLLRLMNHGEILAGGKSDASLRAIEPTVIGNVAWNDPIMQEEIFGPLLPVLEFEDINEVISAVNSKPKPLSLYLFTRNNETKERVMNEVSFGGGMVNDTVEYLANLYLPFGGVGHSGTGAYHGKASFDTFTHYKSVIKKATWLQLPFRYPPYKKRKLWLLKWLLRN